jgi:hypothetical protein
MAALLEMATAGNGAFPATDSAGRQFAELFDGVDDLIHRVAHTECPEILKLRAKVYASMVAAKDAIEDDAHKAPITATQFAAGRGFGVALLLGLGLGFISTLRQD